MKRLLSLIVVGVIMLTPITVLAQPDAPIVVEWQDGVPYDGNGDVIKIEGKGWIYDGTLDKPMFQLVDEKYNVLEQRETTGMRDPTDHEEGEGIEVDEDEEFGWLTLQAELPEDADGKDVLVSIQGEGGSGDYRLIKQNNYEVTVQLPIGTYEVENARIDGDLALTYSCEYNSDTEIRANDGTNLYFTFVKGNLLNAGKTDAAIIQDEEETTTNNKADIIMIILYVLIGIIVVFAGLFVFLLIRNRRDSY